MIILGVDPGIARTGWGIVEKDNSQKLTAKSFGCIETRADLPIERRLQIIREELVRIIKEHKPQALSVEELFFNTNAKTALIVGQARGVVIVTAADLGLEVFSYTPLQVKTAITGYGRAQKDQMGKMVKMLLNLPSIPKPDDTVDALACAITCAFSLRLRSA
ncbi:MAG: crossover junction endodeoxyribonuclease RuvC [Candidatus Levybacteria bacterium RIFCSPHIGHO2_02_FULL_40_18]|nr:MAG: crossover junction endodeoxyribonuclease RuvC [Candidatus Levybacteria bacterium RIFCSPHIGHO2_01_FULL_40_58]OGH26203.1 MAG: crossover junction endodeoxyribonuclease RuvC [Candidatus Levybacteria bacterium RIFCSPHIGHO2_02_FULL_40_18]OGH31455.1 MAG: crossover junction endodeoxyribonuclease RuvC [Candidatus Levybacteria bacterium RIFCSPHIGHO2_12_FULL_40_31]OGH40095.1 MAG: crossover junction endodeoxyribonuclease RuvC [Candidatus Levybacteria bacterium RIFCSPLOWO2_01_FULL_40_64]OGH54302.1 M